MLLNMNIYKLLIKILINHPVYISIDSFMIWADDQNDWLVR